MSAYLYPILLSVAVFLGMFITETVSEDRENSRKMYLFGVLGGIVGARIWFGLQYGRFFEWGGLSLYGFGLGAAVGVASYHRLRSGGWPPTDFPDSAAPALALGIAIHRMGCFFSGCCYGSRCELPWAVQYQSGTPIFNSHVARGLIPQNAEYTLPVHPTQLYSVLVALFVLGILIWMKKTRTGMRRYDAILTAIVLCGIFRFFIEFIRDDAGGVHFGWLTFAQATSLAIAGPSLIFLFVRHRKTLTTA